MLLFSMFLCFLIADCNAASTIANHANVNTGNDSFVGPRYGMSDYAPGNSSLASNGSPQTAKREQVPGYVAVGGVGPAESAIALHKGQIHPPSATHSVQLTTNLDAGTPAGGAPLSTPVTVYDSLGMRTCSTSTSANPPQARGVVISPFPMSMSRPRPRGRPRQPTVWDRWSRPRCRMAISIDARWPGPRASQLPASGQRMDPALPTAS